MLLLQSISSLGIYYIVLSSCIIGSDPTSSIALFTSHIPVIHCHILTDQSVYVLTFFFISLDDDSMQSKYVLNKKKKKKLYYMFLDGYCMASIVDVFEIIVNASYVLILLRCCSRSCLQFSSFFSMLQPHSIRSFNLRMFRILYRTAGRIP
jgi:hypothetical protein